MTKLDLDVAPLVLETYELKKTSYLALHTHTLQG